MEDQYIRRDEAAAYLKNKYGSGAKQTLAKLASVGGGPKFRKFGRYPVYTYVDLDEWAKARTSPLIANTSQIMLQ